MMKISSEVKAQAIADYMNGKTGEQVEEEYGVSRASLYYWLKKNGMRKVKPQCIKITDEIFADTLVRLSKGEKVKDIAKLHNVSENTLRNKLNKRGYKFKQKDIDMEGLAKTIETEFIPDHTFYVPKEYNAVPVMFQGKKYLDITECFC